MPKEPQSTGHNPNVVTGVRLDYEGLPPKTMGWNILLGLSWKCIQGASGSVQSAKWGAELIQL